MGLYKLSNDVLFITLRLLVSKIKRLKCDMFLLHPCSRCYPLPSVWKDVVLRQKKLNSLLNKNGGTLRRDFPEFIAFIAIRCSAIIVNILVYIWKTVTAKRILNYVTINGTIFWDVTPCDFVKVQRHFRESVCRVLVAPVCSWRWRQSTFLRNVGELLSD
jgi:hypothetical protein